MKTHLKITMQVTIDHDDEEGLRSAKKDLKKDPPFHDVASFGKGGYYHIKSGKVINVTATRKKK